MKQLSITETVTETVIDEEKQLSISERVIELKELSISETVIDK